jgi:hypothetical protein
VVVVAAGNVVVLMVVALVAGGAAAVVDRAPFGGDGEQDASTMATTARTETRRDRR